MEEKDEDRKLIEEFKKAVREVEEQLRSFSDEDPDIRICRLDGTELTPEEAVKHMTEKTEIGRELLEIEKLWRQYKRELEK